MICLHDIYIIFSLVYSQITFQRYIR